MLRTQHSYLYIVVLSAIVKYNVSVLYIFWQIIAKAIMCCSGDYSSLGEMAVKYMQEVGHPYPHCGFGGMFYNWMYSDNPKPYGSYGNGAAMRVSACGFAARSLEEAIALSKAVTEVTHNHPEGIKGAEATTVAIYMARTGSNLLEIQDYINKHYYKIDFKLDDIILNRKVEPY